MTALDLDRLERIARAATPGPWAHDESGVWTMHPDALGGPILWPPPKGGPADGVGMVGDSYPRGLNNPTENMAHIAAFDPPTVLALLARVRELEAARGDGVAVVVWSDPVEVAGDMPTAEARARAILDRMEIPGHFSAGELVELANLVADLDRARRRIAALEAFAKRMAAADCRIVGCGQYRCAPCAARDLLTVPAPGATPEEGNDGR